MRSTDAGSTDVAIGTGRQSVYDPPANTGRMGDERDDHDRLHADAGRPDRDETVGVHSDGRAVDRSNGPVGSMPMDGDSDEPDDLGPHQTFVPGRGIYDERNRVNDLTGREWKYATKSVIPEGYPPDVQHELRSEHGGQKPPRLCANLIERFSKVGDRVLDPFAGVGGTLLGASFCEHEGTGLREAIGFERTERWVEIYHTVLERENVDRSERGEPPLAEQSLHHVDCLDGIETLEADSISLLLTDVPYWDMDEREQTRNEAATRPSSLGSFDGEGANSAVGTDSSEGTDSPTGTDSRDGTLQSKDDWLAEMGAAFDAFTHVLEPDSYVVVFIGDMYRGGSYEFLSADLARAIDDATTLTLKAALVWYDPSKDLHVYGYPYAFVPSMVHQHVLVFRNET